MKRPCKKYEAWLQTKNNGTKKMNTIRDDQNEFLFMMVNKINGRLNNKNWIVDSGATCHVTSNKQLLIDFNVVNTVQVQVADGRIFSSRGSGMSKIEFVNNDGVSSWATITDVHYVPEIDFNVLSVGKLALKGVIIEFREMSCNLKYGNKIFGVGTLMNDRQYTLKSSNKVCSLLKTDNNCLHFWHRACGHLDPAVIKELQNSNLVDGVNMKDCEK